MLTTALALLFRLQASVCSTVVDDAWIDCGGIQLEDGPYAQVDPHAVRSCFQARVPTACFAVIDAATAEEINTAFVEFHN